MLLPTSWVLPCCTVEGIVLNIPEMRLYFYRRKPADAPAVLVITHPVGIGPQELQTPRGTYKVRGKTTNPTWVIPNSIRQERIRERGDDRRSIAGGEFKPYRRAVGDTFGGKGCNPAAKWGTVTY